ncbi:MAG TPA: sugar phosphate isomerase/epimerase [Chloroflexi bacterium]|nr:sugar phosphate isomerase/epimerase [Chloroflexota bacterium]
MKIGLYSITYLGVWYDGPALTFKEFMHKAMAMGFDGVEIDGKRPHGNPMDLDQRARDDIRNELEKLGLEMAALSSNNDFSSPVPEHRECQLLMVREQARLAADLGAPVVRLFAAWPGITFRNNRALYEEARNGWERAFPDVPRLERWRLVRECLKEAAAFGEEFGVTMALQNHPPLCHDWQDVVAWVNEVNSPWLKVNLDAPMLQSYADDYVWQAAMAVKGLQVHSHFGGEFYRDAGGTIQCRPRATGDPINYPVFLKGMKEIGYKGYFCYEFCHPAVDEYHNPQGIEYVDEQVALALEYLRGQIAALD